MHEKGNRCTVEEQYSKCAKKNSYDALFRKFLDSLVRKLFAEIDASVEIIKFGNRTYSC